MLRQCTCSLRSEWNFLKLFGGLQLKYIIFNNVRINAASQVFRSLKKSVFKFNHVDLNSRLHFYSCLVLSRLMYGAAESWALTGSQAAQLETSHNSCMRRMMGRYRGTRGPSTAELLDGTGQMPISQLLSRHRVRWLGHAAHKPEGDIHQESCSPGLLEYYYEYGSCTIKH